MKKKISFILILVLLLLPFSILLNVKATGTTIVTTTGDLVDNDVTITINNIAPNDTFQAYKIVDIFYDEEHNSITYDFTTAFQTFINSSQNATVHALTIDKYMNLSDDNGTVTLNGVNQPDVKDILMEYAIYLDSNNISGTTLTKNNNTISHALKAGVYLILPVDTGAYSDGIYGGVGLRINTYKTLLMNGVFTVNEDNEWVLDNQTVSLKAFNTGFEYGINNIAAIEIKNILETSGYVAATQHYMVTPQFNIGQTYSMNVYNDGDITTFDNSTVYGNNVILNKLNSVEITFSQGVDYDISKLYRLFGSVSNISIAEYDAANNVITYTDNNDELTQIGTYSITGQKLKYTVSPNTAMIINISLNSNAVIGSTGNTITYTAYRIKNMYASIDTTITEEDIDNAFIYADTANDTATYQQIRNVLEKLEITATIYTYGIEVTNYEMGTTTNLSGAEFGVFTYDTANSVCTNTQIGSNFTVGNNNKANFKGVDGLAKYCVKQVKAPNGYNLNNTDYIIGPDADYSTVDQNGNYAITITNQRMSALPFTGGVGTIIYIVVGLVIIIGAIIFIIMYKKKNKKDNTKE